MAKDSDLMQSIGKRIANPFVFSFLISWIVYNWKIAVAIVWYNSSNLKAVGYNSLFDLISERLQDSSNFWIPLTWSVLITVAIPLLREIYASFDALISLVGNFLYFKISKESYISTAKYISLKDDYGKLTAELQKVINEEKEYKIKYEESMPKIAQLSQESLALNEMFKQDYLNGTWELSYPKSKKLASIRFISSNVQISQKESNGDLTVYPNDSLSFFMRDIRATEKLVFQVRHIAEGSSMPSLRFYYLTIVGKDRYEGFENFQEQVILTRIN